MRFGPISHYLLLGGGQILFDLAILLEEKGHLVNIITSERHALSSVNLDSNSIGLLEALHSCQIPCLVTGDISTNEAITRLITDKTLGISISAEWIFNNQFISKFNGRLVNLHGSRLPRNRGGAGFSWSIMMGDKLGGSSIHLIDTGIDTGAIVASTQYTFSESCIKPIDFQNISIRQSTLLLGTFITDVEAESDFDLVPQQNDLSTYWPRLNTETHGFIHWDWSLDDIVKFICAFDEPHRGATARMNGNKVFLSDCYADQNDGSFHPFQSGLIYRKGVDRLFVATSGGTLVVKQVSDQEGHSILQKLRVGQRFYTLGKDLDLAYEYKAVYPPESLPDR